MDLRILFYIVSLESTANIYIFYDTDLFSELIKLCVVRLHLLGPPDWPTGEGLEAPMRSENIVEEIKVVARNIHFIDLKYFFSEYRQYSHDFRGVRIFVRKIKWHLKKEIVNKSKKIFLFSMKHYWCMKYLRQMQWFCFANSNTS